MPSPPGTPIEFADVAPIYYPNRQQHPLGTLRGGFRGMNSTTNLTPAYTPLESLLLFQSLLQFGITPSAFADISELLKRNILVKDSPTFDPGRLSPDALQNLFQLLLRDELRSSGGGGGGSGGADGSSNNAGSANPPLSPNSRKRKLPSPSATPLPTLEDARRHFDKLPALVNRLYTRYRDQTAREILEDETRIHNLRREVIEIQKGEWDDRLRREEASRTPSRNGTPVGGAAAGGHGMGTPAHGHHQQPLMARSGPVQHQQHQQQQQQQARVQAPSQPQSPMLNGPHRPSASPSVQSTPHVPKQSPVPPPRPIAPENRRPPVVSPSPQPTAAAAVSTTNSPALPATSSAAAPAPLPPATAVPSPQIPSSTPTPTTIPSPVISRPTPSPAPAQKTPPTPVQNVHGSPQVASAQVHPSGPRPPGPPPSTPQQVSQQQAPQPQPQPSSRPASQPSTPQQPTPAKTAASHTQSQPAQAHAPARTATPVQAPTRSPVQPPAQVQPAQAQKTPQQQGPWPPYPGPQQQPQHKTPVPYPQPASQHYPIQPAPSPQQAQPQLTKPHAPKHAPSHSPASVLQHPQASSPYQGKPQLAPVPAPPLPPEVKRQDGVGARPPGQRPLKWEPVMTAGQVHQHKQPHGPQTPQAHMAQQTGSLQQYPPHSSNLRTPQPMPLSPSPGTTTARLQPPGPPPPPPAAASPAAGTQGSVLVAPTASPMQPLQQQQQAQQRPVAPPAVSQAQTRLAHPQQPPKAGQPQPPAHFQPGYSSPGQQVRPPAAVRAPAPCSTQNVPATTQAHATPSPVQPPSTKAGPPPAHVPPPPPPKPLVQTSQQQQPPQARQQHGLQPAPQQPARNGQPSAAGSPFRKPPSAVPEYVCPAPTPTISRPIHTPSAPQTPAPQTPTAANVVTGSGTRWRVDPTPGTPRPDAGYASSPKAVPLSPVLGLAEPAPASRPQAQAEGSQKKPSPLEASKDVQKQSVKPAGKTATTAASELRGSGAEPREDAGVSKRQPALEKIDTSRPSRRSSRGPQKNKTSHLGPPRRGRSKSVASAAGDASPTVPEMPSAKVKEEVATPRIPDDDDDNDDNDDDHDADDATADESQPQATPSRGPTQRASRLGKRKRDETPATPTLPIPTSPPSHVLWTRGFPKVSASVLDQISSHRYANMFASAVKKRDAPRYNDIVRHAQDLKNIRSAIHAGQKAATQALASLSEGGDPATASSVWLPWDESLVPPKGIINTEQLECELVHMFANAIMYNPDPFRGPGPAFRKPYETEDEVNVLGYMNEPDVVVKDTRNMYVEVEKLLSDLRSAEKDQPPLPPGATGIFTDAHLHAARSIMSASRGASSSMPPEDEGDVTATDQDQEATEGRASKRRRKG